MRIAYWTGYSPVFDSHTVVTEDWELPGGGWGSERSLAQMAVELVKRGHHVEIFCWRTSPLPVFNATEFDVIVVQRYLHFWLLQQIQYYAEWHSVKMLSMLAVLRLYACFRVLLFY